MITVYTTPSCVACKSVKQFLDSRGVQYETKDVTANDANMMEFIKFGVSAVPVTTDGEKVIVGFNQAELEGMIKG